MTQDKALTLSETMLEALDYAKANGGQLHRLPGGYWVAGKDKASNIPSSVKYFGSKTIGALVKRGVADYTAHRAGTHGDFPVEMTIRQGQQS